jgi:hypothetical protein
MTVCVGLNCFQFTVGNMFVEIFNDIGEEEIDVGEGWVDLGVV